MGMANRDPIPAHAVTLWLTDHDIIAALPMTTGGTPYLMKFPLSEGGLMQALSLLHKRKAEVLDPAEARQLLNLRSDPTQGQPQVKLSRADEKLKADGITDAQRANARALLAKMGIKS